MGTARGGISPAGTLIAYSARGYAHRPPMCRVVGLLHLQEFLHDAIAVLVIDDRESDIRCLAMGSYSSLKYRP